MESIAVTYVNQVFPEFKDSLKIFDLLGLHFIIYMAHGHIVWVQ